MKIHFGPAHLATATIPDAKNHLSDVRRAVLEQRDYHRADEICHKMQGLFAEAYQPLGDLRLTFQHRSSITDYRRELNLDTACARVRYTTGETHFEREAFVSAPGQAIVLRVTADQPHALHCTLSLSGLLAKSVEALSPARLLLRGKAASHIAGAGHPGSEKPVTFSDRPGMGMYFALVAEVLAEDGTAAAHVDRIEVANATTLTVKLTAATGFRGFDQVPDTPLDAVVLSATRQLDSIRTQPVSALREEHIRDHQRLFRRMSLNLASPASADSTQSTDKRLNNFASSPDPSLIALYFQYGRYLLISSSRPGSQPANLQGIWNNQITPPWSSNWTANINVQMNYWPSETCNLSECAEPLFNLIRDLTETGKRTATEMYGLPGWVSHHNIDLWRTSNPVGEGVGQPTWANWGMSGPWLCEHLYEHYLFTRDRDFLQNRAYPLMKSCAEFCLAWLCEDGKGHLTTCPSFSTENDFLAPDGKRAMTSAGCTMDMALLRELFRNCIAASEELGVDTDLANKLRGAVAGLRPYQVGKYGQLARMVGRLRRKHTRPAPHVAYVSALSR